MPQPRRSENRRRRKQAEIAPKLIGAGLLLGILPLFLGKSPVGLALKPMAPFGWLILAIGCGLLWWQARSSKQHFQDILRTGDDKLPEPFLRSRVEPGFVDVLPTEFGFAQPESRLWSATPRPVPQSWGAEVFDVIEWRRFEAVVEALFAQAGFQTKSQSHGADEGVDIWLYSRNNPGTPVSVVQCKHWQGKRVCVDKVRELRGVMAAKGVSRGQFATTSMFTDEAISFAKESGVNLLDVKKLLALIAERNKEQQRALLSIALRGDYWRPTCVNCGIKMVERNPRKGGAAFWGCEGYPRCKTTLPMRAAANMKF